MQESPMAIGSCALQQRRVNTGKRCRREIHRQKVERLNSDSAKKLPVAEYNAAAKGLIGGLAKQRIEIAGGAMEASSRDRMLGVIKKLNQHLSGLAVRNVTSHALEQWAMARRLRGSKRRARYREELSARIGSRVADRITGRPVGEAHRRTLKM